MTIATIVQLKTMTYTHRQATPEDAPALAPLWEAFARDRAAVDP